MHHPFKLKPPNWDKRCKTHFVPHFELLWCQRQILMVSLSPRVNAQTIFDSLHLFSKPIFEWGVELAISQPKMVRLPRNEKQTHRLNSRLQMGPSGLTLAMTLTLNFQGQISNWLYLSQKWSDCHETKSKHIDWTLGFKWDHRVWPWPWPWPWIFKVKYRIGYISAKNGPIAMKRNANTLTEL